MQRIDENTYIDDTLVTCAEYQLFIDEMRHFLSVIRRETEPICTLDDGINALEIALQTLSFKVDKSC